MFTVTEEKKQFYARAVGMILPMALQNLINVGVSAADVFMLGRVSETVLSAASLAGQVYFVVSLFLFGITSGASVLTAQYWGKKNVDAIEKVMGLALLIGLVVSAAFSVVVWFWPEAVMHIFTNEPAVIAEGVKYLRIVLFSYTFSTISTVYLYIMRSVERVIVATAVYAMSFVLNVVLNAVFIFGMFGCPAMGVEGAALGTLFARIFEVLCVAVYAHFINHEVRLRLRYIIHVESWVWKDFMHYSGAVILNELFWGMAVSATTAIIGHLGEAASAASAVAQVSRQLATVVSFGVASSAAVVVGKAIGEGKKEQAVLYSKRFIMLGGVTGTCGAALILLFRPAIISAFVTSAEAADDLHLMLFVISYYAVCMSVSCTMIVGLFRAGGDTKIGMLLDTGLMWGISIPFGALAAFVWKLPVKTVYVILMSDEVIKIFFSTARYRSFKWLKNVTR
jgi:putative MATE family efflux protein